jgi:hypothetical protein
MGSSPIVVIHGFSKITHVRTTEGELPGCARPWGHRHGPVARAADPPDAPHPLVAPGLRRLVRVAENRCLPWVSYGLTMGSPAVAGPNVVAFTVGVPSSVVARHLRHASVSAGVTHVQSAPETRLRATTAGHDATGVGTAGTRPTRPRQRRHRAAAAVYARAAAAVYARAAAAVYARAAEHHTVDFEMAHRVAEAFSAAPRSSSGARVESAYAALGEQACRHFRFLTSDESRNPIRVVFTDSPAPYTNAHELSASVRLDRVLELCPAQRDRDRRHPRLDTSTGGTYDQFRAVHDIISHGWLGHAFDRDGEFSAWLAEHHFYTGLARWALATELHGGHSVRWTTGEPADHKAILLGPTLLTASRRARRDSPSHRS